MSARQLGSLASACEEANHEQRSEGMAGLTALGMSAVDTALTNISGVRAFYPIQSSEMNGSEHDFAQTVALANGRALRVVADARDSIRVEEWETDMAPTYSVVLTNRDMYNLWNAMVEALRRTRIREARDPD